MPRSVYQNSMLFVKSSCEFLFSVCLWVFCLGGEWHDGRKRERGAQVRNWFSNPRNMVSSKELWVNLSSHFRALKKVSSTKTINDIR